MKPLSLIILCLLCISFLDAQEGFICTRTYKFPKAKSGAFKSWAVSFDLSKIAEGGNQESDLKSMIEKGSIVKSKDEKRLVLKSEGNSFIANEKGEAINEDRFQFLRQNFDGYFIAGRTDGKWGVFDENLLPVLEVKYDDLFCINNNKGWLIQENGKWGMIDGSKKEIIPFKYDDILLFNDNLFIARNGENQTLINNKGEILRELGAVCFKPSEKKDLPYFYVQKNHLIGVYDFSGKEIVAPNYHAVKIRYEGRSPQFVAFELIKDGKVGMVDFDGKLICPAEHNRIRILRHRKEGKELIINANKENQNFLFVGDQRIDIRADEFLALRGKDKSSDFVLIKKLNQLGLVNCQSLKIIEPAYQEIRSYNDSVFVVKQRGRFGLINDSGATLLPTEYDSIEEFNHDEQYYPIPLAKVELDGKFGYLNDKYELIVAPKYHRLFAFAEGRARVMNNYKWGYIDIAGKEVVPLKYDSAGAFSGDRAQVSLNGEVIYIDLEGNCVLNCQ